MQLHFPESDPSGFEGLLDQGHIVMIEGLVLGLDVYDLADAALDDQLGAPEAGYFCGVEDGSWSFGDSCREDAVVFSVDAPAAQDLRSHFFTVVADLAASVVAVDRSHRSTIVP